MPRKIFLNLPVKNLDRSVSFFSQLGFEFEGQFTDQNAASMILSDDAYVMLLVEEFFQTFTAKTICDARSHIEAIVAISAGSRQEVDQLGGHGVGGGRAAGQRAGRPGFHVQRELPGPRRPRLGSDLDRSVGGGGGMTLARVTSREKWWAARKDDRVAATRPRGAGGVAS